MSILISILLGFHVKILIRIEEGWLTELVMFFIGHYYNIIIIIVILFTIKPCSFFSILFCIFLIIIIWSRKKKGIGVI